MLVAVLALRAAEDDAPAPRPERILAPPTFAPAAGPNAQQEQVGGRAALSPPVVEAGPASYPGLHNVVAATDEVWSGAVPAGAAGFESLRRLGVRTVISVDGARPDLAEAARQGLRYVHLPVQYRAIRPERRAQLARALRDLPRPIYVHCHHGKHRAPSAAAAALIGLGELDVAAGCALQQRAGTAASYVGLYECVRSATRIDAAELNLTPAEFPAVHSVESVVAAMVSLDQTWERLLAIDAAGWATPPEHPDLTPAAEAGQLADMFRVLTAECGAADYAPQFQSWLHESATAGATLESALLAGRHDRVCAPFQRIQTLCIECHRQWRDR